MESPERVGVSIEKDHPSCVIIRRLETRSPLKTFAIPIAILIVAAAFAGCTNNVPPSTSSPAVSTPASSAPTKTPSTPAPAPLKADLLESGSTFVLPLAQKWAAAFSASNPGVSISANGGGSGKGKGDITANLVDIAGSDSIMDDAAIAKAGGDIIHLPVAAGAIVIAYNVPEVGSTPLKFNADTIANIFLGKITKWNDPALAALNPGVSLPNEDMAVVHRSDGSGTTDTFTDYLSKANAEWKSTVGKGASVTWPCEKVTPACTGASGNNGVGGQVQTIPYSITYLGGEWADITKVQTGVVVNAAGQAVAASAETVGASIAAAVSTGAFDDKLRGSVTNMDCPTCYPIAAVTWLLVHEHQTDKAKGEALVAFLRYVLHEGQALNDDLNYNPIPAAVVAKADAFVASIDYNGQPLATMG